MTECKILKPTDIKYIVIHCSDTDNHHKSEDIHKLHLSFGWDGIGYHKIIRQDGVIENGRPEYWIGAHVKGFNSVSLGICLIGKNKFSHDQFNSLKKILKNWKVKYKNAEVIGHNNFDYTNKTCPNFDVKNWYKKNIL